MTSFDLITCRLSPNMLRYWELELYHIFFFGQGRGHSSIYDSHGILSYTFGEHSSFSSWSTRSLWSQSLDMTVHSLVRPTLCTHS